MILGTISCFWYYPARELPNEIRNTALQMNTWNDVSTLTVSIIWARITGVNCAQLRNTSKFNLGILEFPRYRISTRPAEHME